MPTTIETNAVGNNTYIITTVFTDDDGNLVIPNDPCTWSLSDSSGAIINSREDVAIVEASSVDIVLTGDDLATTGATDDGIRVLSIEGDYDSDAGAGLSLNKSAQFIVDHILPVSLYDIKDHLRLTQDVHADDVDVALRLTAARERVEQFIGRKLMTQTVVEYFEEFPDGDCLTLRHGDVASVTTIKYTDYAGDQSTWADTNYIADTDNDPGRVVLAYSKSWPTDVLYPVNPIEVTYVCGYGANAGDVPEMVKAAIRLWTSDLYENREPSLIGQGFTYTETQAVEKLLMPHKVWR